MLFQGFWTASRNKANTAQSQRSHACSHWSHFQPFLPTAYPDLHHCRAGTHPSLHAPLSWRISKPNPARPAQMKKLPESMATSWSSVSPWKQQPGPWLFKLQNLVKEHKFREEKTHLLPPTMYQILPRHPRKQGTFQPSWPLGKADTAGSRCGVLDKVPNLLRALQALSARTLC